FWFARDTIFGRRDIARWRETVARRALPSSPTSFDRLSPGRRPTLRALTRADSFDFAQCLRIPRPWPDHRDFVAARCWKDSRDGRPAKSAISFDRAKVEVVSQRFGRRARSLRNAAGLQPHGRYRARAGQDKERMDRRDFRKDDGRKS